jgi:hypothetical protein
MVKVNSKGDGYKGKQKRRSGYRSKSGRGGRRAGAGSRQQQVLLPVGDVRLLDLLQVMSPQLSASAAALALERAAVGSGLPKIQSPSAAAASNKQKRGEEMAGGSGAPARARRSRVLSPALAAHEQGSSLGCFSSGAPIVAHLTAVPVFGIGSMASHTVLQ